MKWELLVPVLAYRDTDARLRTSSIINNLIIYTMMTGIATRQGPLSRHSIDLRSYPSVSSIWSLVTLITVRLYRDDSSAWYQCFIPQLRAAGATAALSMWLMISKRESLASVGCCLYTTACLIMVPVYLTALLSNLNMRPGLAERSVPVELFMPRLLSGHKPTGTSPFADDSSLTPVSWLMSESSHFSWRARNLDNLNPSGERSVHRTGLCSGEQLGLVDVIEIDWSPIYGSRRKPYQTANAWEFKTLTVASYRYPLDGCYIVHCIDFFWCIGVIILSHKLAVLFTWRVLLSRQRWQCATISIVYTNLLL